MAHTQTVLVTGATSGIGLLIADTLHNNGYLVSGTNRYPEKHKDKVPFELLPLDVTSDVSIQKCVDALFAKTPVLDVLINNAGGFLSGTVEETTMEQAYKQFETNFWGTVKMTKAVLPIMRKQRSGKIITIGSLNGLIGFPLSSYYVATKHALEGFFKSLRLEVKNFNIKVSVIEPSFYKTNIDAASDHAAGTIADYDEIRKRVTDFVEQSVSSSPTPGPVAELVLKIVQIKDPKFSYPIGKNTTILPLLQFFSPAMFENGFLKKLKL